MSRRQRVPGMKASERQWLEIPTGGNPLMALIRGHDLDIGRGQVVHVSIAHDAGCPCLRGRPMPFCTCELVRLQARKVA